MAILDDMVRTYETSTKTDTGIRTKPKEQAPALPKFEDRLQNAIDESLKAVGTGFNKIKDWVVKPKDGEADEPGSAPSADRGDLEDRLDDALRGVNNEIRDRERDTTELDRKLHDAQKELIRLRAQEQHVREMQLRVGQTKQLSEDLERKMAMLDDMVRTYETSTKTDTGIRAKPKEPAPALPKFEDRLESAINEALKSVATQEKKVAEIEAQLGRANTALVEERTRQQRIRSMQMKLRQSRHFSNDLHRALAAMSASIEDLKVRAGNLLKPEARGSKAVAKKPVPAEAPAPTKAPTTS